MMVLSTQAETHHNKAIY